MNNTNPTPKNAATAEAVAPRLLEMPLHYTDYPRPQVRENDGWVIVDHLDEESAKFIVTACNSFATLTAQLEAAKGQLTLLKEASWAAHRFLVPKIAGDAMSNLEQTLWGIDGDLSEPYQSDFNAKVARCAAAGLTDQGGKKG